MDTYTSNEDGLLGRRRRLNLWEKSIISSQRLAFDEAIADYLPVEMVNLIFEEVKNNMRKKLCPKCSTRTADFESCDRALCSDIWCRPCIVANVQNYDMLYDKVRRFAACCRCCKRRCMSHYGNLSYFPSDRENIKFNKVTEESSCIECDRPYRKIPMFCKHSLRRWVSAGRVPLLTPSRPSPWAIWYCHVHALARPSLITLHFRNF
jgi:hypothetical protein